MHLISALVHLLNLYLCALLLFPSLLLSYSHPCPRLAVRRNDKNREISGKAITVIGSVGILFSVWADGAGNTPEAIKPPSPVLTDLDLLAPEPSVAIAPTDEWHFGKSIAPVVLSKKPDTGSNVSQLRPNKKRGWGLEEEGSRPALQIHLEPFKLFTESESPRANIKIAMLSGQPQPDNPFLLHGFSRRMGGSSEEIVVFSQVKGWRAYEMCPIVADVGQYVFML